MANYTLNYTGEKVDELLNKIDTAFGETTVMGDTLTWDGDMTDKPVVTLDMGEDGVLNFCKVSEVIPTLEDMSNGIIVTIPNVGSQEITTGDLIVGDGYIIASVAASILEPNTLVEEYGLTFPETGTWLVSQSGMYASEVKINNYTGFETTEITTIDPKYLPDPEVIFTVNTRNMGYVDGATITCNKSLSSLLELTSLVNTKVVWNETVLLPIGYEISKALMAVGVSFVYSKKWFKLITSPTGFELTEITS